MQNWSIQQKVYGVMAILLIVQICSGWLITDALHNAADDSVVSNALGRQRMLTQAMVKSSLGYAISKGRVQTIKNNISSLDNYITKMRGTYTKMVIGAAKKAGLTISIDPASEDHPAVPYPATLARVVNEKFGAGKDFKIDIIAEDPVNSAQTLKTDLDKEAFAYLKDNSEEVFSKVFEEDGRLLIGLYTADKATVPVCASCHTAIKGKPFKVGDMLGIRSYRLVYSPDVAVGKSELNASLDEYNSSRDLFASSLAAAKKGGKVSLDLKGTKFKTIKPVDSAEFQNKASQVEKKFAEFRNIVKTMLNSAVGSGPYRKAQATISIKANELRGVSNDLVEIFSAIAEKNQSRIQTVTIISTIIGVIIAAGIILFLTSVVIKPVQKISNVLRDTSHGNLKQEKLAVSSSDEIGTLSLSCNQLTEGLQKFIHHSEDILAGNTQNQTFTLEGDFKSALESMLEQAKVAHEFSERERQQAEELKSKVDQILDVVSAAAEGDLTKEVTVSGEDAIGQLGEGFSKFVSDLRAKLKGLGENVQTLAASSEELTAVGQTMSTTIQETATQASLVATATDQVTKNVEAVAAGAEEMNVSIKEIAQNSSEAARVAGEAVKVAETTNDTVSKLGQSSAEIGQVIKVINSIAEQTNLLALNATIEAARAGEAGKGFAVVANEVKELAKETSKATEEISNKIQAIQTDTQGAVEAIGDITMVINQISDISTTIAGAVEEQTATTSEIGRTIAEAAQGTIEISQNITGVSQAAQNTTGDANNTLGAAQEVARMAGEQHSLISYFKF
jgi:methyl-accepting chemotaxis protein